MAYVPLRTDVPVCTWLERKLFSRVGSLRTVEFLRCVRKSCGSSSVKMAEALAKVPDVEIDPEGTFKYILLRIKIKDGDAFKDIVRGTKNAEYHNHILEKVSPAMEALGFECKCLGGGKIEHNSSEKKIRVFGESTAFGKADHAVSTEKLKSAFSGYEVTWSDDKK